MSLYKEFGCCQMTAGFFSDPETANRPVSINDSSTSDLKQTDFVCKAEKPEGTISR